MVPAIPEICTYGETIEEAREMARDAIRCFLESAFETGEPIPVKIPSGPSALLPDAEGIIIRKTMPVTIPDEVLTAAHMSEAELKRELALTLFQRERLTLGQASRLAGMSQLAFQALLADRQIPIHYGVEEFREDIRAFRQTDPV